VHRRIDKRYTFRAVSFTSVDSGTVVGDDQSRWLTTNGGQTWDMFDYYSGSQGNTTHDVLRINLQTYMLATPSGFEAYDAKQSYRYTPDEGYGYPVYGLATAGRSGPVVGVGHRTVVRRHENYSTNREITPWVYVHAPDGTSIDATFYAADFADASTFYAVGPRGLIYRFHYQ
jgi:photosystem II stability/assembly factor-like uncharacterized protein